MSPEILEKQAKLFIEIIDNLNRIKRILLENEIDDGKSLFEDRDILDSLCHKVLMVYEFYSQACFKNNRKYAGNRATLAHITDNLNKRNGLIGFDEIDPAQLWSEHFDTAIPQIESDVGEKIKDVPKLGEDIDRLSSSEIKPAIKLLEASDFSHLSVIKDIANDISMQTVCLVGLLNVISSESTPPTKEELFNLVTKITNRSNEQLEFVVGELVKRNILSRSTNNNYLFIMDDSFGINTTRDFIGRFDINEIIRLLRE